MKRCRGLVLACLAVAAARHAAAGLDRWTHGIAAHDDGTVAVAWAHLTETGTTTGAVQRFRACE